MPLCLYWFSFFDLQHFCEVGAGSFAEQLAMYYCHEDGSHDVFELVLGNHLTLSSAYHQAGQVSAITSELFTHPIIACFDPGFISTEQDRLIDDAVEGGVVAPEEPTFDVLSTDYGAYFLQYFEELFSSLKQFSEDGFFLAIGVLLEDGFGSSFHYLGQAFDSTLVDVRHSSLLSFLTLE